MNDEQRNAPDLSKIVGLIMENPQLIEEIANLAKKSEKPTAPEEDISVTEDKPDEVAQAAIPIKDNKDRRMRLLCALKPYVSEGRAKAIDSIISISDMLEVMKAR